MMILGTRSRVIRAFQSGTKVGHDWSIGEMSRRVVTTRTTTGKIFNVLMREGLVKRIQDPHSRPVWRWVT